MELKEIRQIHKKLHGSRAIQKQAIKERIEMGRSVEDVINTDNRRKSKYKFYFGTKKCGEKEKNYDWNIKKNANETQ